MTELSKALCFYPDNLRCACSVSVMCEKVDILLVGDQSFSLGSMAFSTCL